MTTQSIKGFADLFAPQSDTYTFIEKTARQIFQRYGYEELRTPIMEYTELFCRGIGTETDVVQKEMYTFPDRKDRSLTLRPEATAGVMRAYIQAKRHNIEPVSKLFTTGPMFRYERPQKGRMRQFHQINCECLGASHPRTDAEVITMLTNFLHEIGIKDFEIQINTLGCSTCRPQYRATLSQYLRELDQNALCEDCRRRVETNPLRVLDCKVPSCKEHTAKAPQLPDHVCEDCSTAFSVVLELLHANSEVSFVVNPRLVRGLDYYCRTTFEVVSQGIGAQTSIAGGGRYDGLVQQLGGPDVPGIGFACGMERLAMLLPEMTPQRPDFHIVYTDEPKASAMTFALSTQLRQAGFIGDFSHNGGSFKSQMRQAGKINARFALIIGENEVNTQSIAVKNMDTSEQITVTLAEITTYLQDNLQADEHGESNESK